MEINTLLHAELPATYILSLAVLPKGEVWPNRCSDAILTVNAELQVRSPTSSPHPCKAHVLLCCAKLEGWDSQRAFLVPMLATLKCRGQRCTA